MSISRGEVALGSVDSWSQKLGETATTVDALTYMV